MLDSDKVGYGCKGIHSLLSGRRLHQLRSNCRLRGTTMEAGRIKGELPEWLLRQILLRLPVRSLCRFRCVSKLWRSLISDPPFIEAHRACSDARPELLISYGWESVRSQNSFHLILRGKEKTTIHTELYFTAYPLRRCTDPTIQTLTPACHDRSLISVPGPMSHQVGGLYCLDSGTSVRLCNPATGEFFDLGTVFNPFLMKRTESNATICITNHFGFDPVERKHKVLSIWNSPWFECYVFVLEDNYWTKILDDYPRRFDAPEINNVVCVDGVVFSAPFKDVRGKQVLVAFDVRTETFRVIQKLPEWHRARKLIEFAGRAALVTRDTLGPRNDWRITLWVLEDLAQRVWRRKDCRIPSWGEERLMIQGGTPAGELILIPTGSKKPFFLLIYNVESNALRRVELQGIPPNHSLMFLRFHVESLCCPKAKQASAF